MKTHTQTQWGDSELLYLRQNWMTETDREIADTIGKTDCAVKCKRIKLGLSKSRYISIAKKADMLCRVERGDQPLEIARDYGMGVHTLYYHIGKLYAKRYSTN